MKITYNEIDDITKLNIIDIISKQESIKSELADVQTERAQNEVTFKNKEQTLQTEANKLTNDLRNLRKATME